MNKLIYFIFEIANHPFSLTPDNVKIITRASSPSLLKINLKNPMQLDLQMIKPNEPVRIKIKLENIKPIYFNGIITHIFQKLKPCEQITITAETLDRQLQINKINHVFHQYSIEKIVCDIYRKYRLTYSLKKNLHTLSTFNQINQTDFDFLNQLFNLNQLHYYHDHFDSNNPLVITDNESKKLRSIISLSKMLDSNNHPAITYQFNQQLILHSPDHFPKKALPTLLTANSNHLNNAFRFYFEKTHQYQYANHTELFAEHHSGSFFQTAMQSFLLINFVYNDADHPIIIGTRQSDKNETAIMRQKNNSISLYNEMTIQSHLSYDALATSQQIIKSKVLNITSSGKTQIDSTNNEINLFVKTADFKTLHSSITMNKNEIVFNSPLITIN